MAELQERLMAERNRSGDLLGLRTGVADLDDARMSERGVQPYLGSLWGRQNQPSGPRRHCKCSPSPGEGPDRRMLSVYPQLVLLLLESTILRCRLISEPPTTTDPRNRLLLPF